MIFQDSGIIIIMFLLSALHNGFVASVSMYASSYSKVSRTGPLAAEVSSREGLPVEFYKTSQRVKTSHSPLRYTSYSNSGPQESNITDHVGRMIQRPSSRLTASSQKFHQSSNVHPIKTSLQGFHSGYYHPPSTVVTKDPATSGNPVPIPRRLQNTSAQGNNKKHASDRKYPLKVTYSDSAYHPPYLKGNSANNGNRNGIKEMEMQQFRNENGNGVKVMNIQLLNNGNGEDTIYDSEDYQHHEVHHEHNEHEHDEHEHDEHDDHEHHIIYEHPPLEKPPHKEEETLESYLFSTYHIGYKLYFVPLYVGIIFVVYVLYLALRDVYRHKVLVPYDFLNDPPTRNIRATIDETTRTVMRALEQTEHKYR